MLQPVNEPIGKVCRAGAPWLGSERKKAILVPLLSTASHPCRPTRPDNLRTVALRIATFNVNGVNGRLPRLLEWLAESAPDVACLQEIKTGDATFPAAALEAAGYGAVWHGQPKHHGVAILARGEVPVEVRRGLPGDALDAQARYLEADVKGLRVASIYLPNGNPQPGPKFDYKLAWFERLAAHAQTLLGSGHSVVLAGDFNVVPTHADIYNAWLWRFDAVLQPETRAAYQRLLAQGWVDATRQLHPDERVYTFWVNAEAFRRNAGFRMDFLLVDPALAQRLSAAEVDHLHRGREKPSDHAPVWIELGHVENRCDQRTGGCAVGGL
jgi:exodeoxyribonuclease-3